MNTLQTLKQRNKVQLSKLAAVLISTATIITGCQSDKPIEPVSDNYIADEQVKQDTLALLTSVIKQQTWRLPDRSNEATALQNLDNIRHILWKDLQAFNAQQSHIKFQQHQWKKAVNGKTYWVYSYRIGSGDNLVSIISHMDTVAPGDESWRPFELRQEQRAYPEEAEQTFLVGRGAIDDKGPAIFALDAIKAIAKEYDSIDTALGNTTIEMLFDTSEETSMSMPHYFKDCPECEPDFGIVFDSKWCVRAEKGIERPVFFVPVDHGSDADEGIIVSHIETFNNPTNQIPGKVQITFTSKNASLLNKLRSSISHQYDQASFDDENYRKAQLNIVEKKNAINQLTIELLVAGAQHGSVPERNRQHGANPLVSSLNLIDTLMKSDNQIDTNAYTELARFSSWAWGTKVLGEHHPSLHAGSDGVFEPGTTYAITKINPVTIDGVEKLGLFVDIRFSMDHHDTPWDGKDGTVAGHSKFLQVFTTLTTDYKKRYAVDIGFNSKMLYAPDIRNPENNFFQSVNTAYKKVTGVDCPMHAIGGGTDAKGRPQLVAGGPLFKPIMGYPVNYHGINEAAPLKDLMLSRKILIEILKQEIAAKP